MKTIEKNKVLTALEGLKTTEEHISATMAIAEQFAQDDCKITFSFFIKNLTKEKEKKDLFDEDGSLRRVGETMGLLGWLGRGTGLYGDNNENEVFKQEIDEGLALQMLSFYINRLKLMRIQFVEELKKHNIKV